MQKLYILFLTSTVTQFVHILYGRSCNKIYNIVKYLDCTCNDDEKAKFQDNTIVAGKETFQLTRN